jgi:NADH-quinone oxidoreductase subunit C
VSVTAARIAAVLEGLAHTFVEHKDGLPTIEIARGDVHEVCARLKQRAGFETNTFVTAVDHHPRAPRFEMAWQFLSYEHNDRVRVHARLAEDDAKVATITDLFPGASFAERECYDMFGIAFEGHPDLRRLLMPQGYEHFPLRKDFPHQGIEPDKLYRTWDRQRRKEWDAAK